MSEIITARTHCDIDLPDGRRVGFNMLVTGTSEFINPLIEAGKADAEEGAVNYLLESGVVPVVV